MPTDALDHYNDRISEATAQEILATFGISGPSPEYERWVRDDGFRPIDLVDVLRPSPRHITIDWRDALEDVFMELTRAFESHGFDTSCDSTFVDEGRRETGVIRLGSHGIEFERTREGIVDFKQRLRELEIATSDALAFRLNDGSDTCVLALLRHEDWARLDALDAKVITYLFGDLLPKVLPRS